MLQSLISSMSCCCQEVLCQRFKRSTMSIEARELVAAVANSRHHNSSSSRGVPGQGVGLCDGGYPGYEHGLHLPFALHPHCNPLLPAETSAPHTTNCTRIIVTTFFGVYLSQGMFLRQGNSQHVHSIAGETMICVRANLQAGESAAATQDCAELHSLA